MRRVNFFFLAIFFCVSSFNFSEGSKLYYSNHKHREWIRFEEGKRTVLFFHSEGCGFSVAIRSQIKEIEKYLTDRFIIQELNFDEEEVLVDDFMIDATPTLVFLRANGEEYFRWNGIRPGQENAAVISQFASTYSADSDIEKDDMSFLFDGDGEYEKVIYMLDRLLRRGHFSTFFQGLKKNNLSGVESFYLRAEAYFRLKKFLLSDFFFYVTVITEAKGVENLDWYSVFPKYISRFGKIKDNDYFFGLLSSLIKIYPENPVLRLEYASLARQTGQNTELALEQLLSLQQQKLQPKYHWAMSRLMQMQGDCSAIEKLLAENEIEEPYRRAVIKELEDCQVK